MGWRFNHILPTWLFSKFPLIFQISFPFEIYFKITSIDKIYDIDSYFFYVETELIFVHISAETALIFFIVSYLMPCFGFRGKTVLITHRRFGCCWAELYRAKNIAHFQLLILSCQRGSWENSSWEGTKIRIVGLNWSKVYSKRVFHAIWMHSTSLVL